VLQLFYTLTGVSLLFYEITVVKLLKISKFHALIAALSLLCSIYSGNIEWSIIMHFTCP